MRLRVRLSRLAKQKSVEIHLSYFKIIFALTDEDLISGTAMVVCDRN